VRAAWRSSARRATRRRWRAAVSIVTIDSAAWPFVLVAAVPALLATWLLPAAAAVPFWLLPAAVALFFRDPVRHAPAGHALVLSPADGRVMHAGPARPGEAPPGDWLQITIFLSVLDVHINRTPVSGIVRRVAYVPGSFRAAFRPDAHRNEHSEIWIDHDGVDVVARQVVGVLARRVVCRVKAGDQLHAGDRIGLMKFGSRMDVFVPVSSTITVAAGDRVAGGSTVIARLAGGDA
jgi:phosphatidylserine decarboxylase